MSVTVKKGSGNQTQRSQGGENENSQGGGGGGRGGKPCEGGCGVEKTDFNHCVHCAQKLCDNCR